MQSHSAHFYIIIHISITQKNKFINRGRHFFEKLFEFRFIEAFEAQNNPSLNLNLLRIIEQNSVVSLRTQRYFRDYQLSIKIIKAPSSEGA